ncbi:MAG: putative lipopolysaccharide heptosyltransferase III [Chlamydiota bacterium]
MYGDYPDLKCVKKILVVKMRHHGDVLLTSPIFTLLKKNMPHAEVHAFIYKDTLPMLEGHPAIAQFHLYDRGWKKLSLLKKLSQEVATLRKIRKEKYDLVINLTEGDRGAIVAFISNAQFRVGFDPENKGFKGKKKIYTHTVKNCKTPRHTVEKQLDVLRRIGIFPELKERDLCLHISEEAKSSVRAHLPVKEGYIVIHPVSRWRFKCLPPKKIAELIIALHARGFPIVLSASPDIEELAMCEEILKEAPGIPVCHLGGKISLKELGALIKGSKCLICVDSVPLHIASATKTPVIALFGPTSDQNWGPWMHPQARVVAQKTSCRPCLMDGCGGSKMSDCLFTLPISSILSALDALALQ